jgi:hypothetical protein
MTTATIIPITRRLEPVAHDTFIDDLRSPAAAAPRGERRKVPER